MDLRDEQLEKEPFDWKALVAAASVVALLIVCAVVVAHKRHAAAPKTPPGTILPLDGYAANLAVTGVEMSETEALGGRIIYVDGHVTNNGERTVTGITVQTIFSNDELMPPQVETMPLMLIRTRDPEVDTEAVSREPLKPGDSREFRLIFDHVTENWNQAYPEIRVVGVQP
jgi:hypothetical protein